MRRVMLVASAVLALAACGTLRPLPDAQPNTIRKEVRAGDYVELQRTDGERFKLSVDEINDEFLVGSDGQQRHLILLNAIRSISVRR